MTIPTAAELFVTVKEGDLLEVEIIGRRFVLNDTHVTIIAILQELKDCNRRKNECVSNVIPTSTEILTEKQKTKRKREKHI